MRNAHLFSLVPAAVGVLLGAIAYLGSETGVDGTPGALLALIGAVAVSIGNLLAMSARLGGGMRWTLDALIGLGAFLTAVAAWFLMQYAFAVAMVLALLGLSLAVALSSRKAAA